MELLKKTYHFFFISGIFLLPFNSETPSWLGFLGEYSADSSPLFFLIAFAFLVLHFLLGNKVFIPFKSTEASLLLFFFGCIILVTFLNLSDILDYYFKKTSGIERFIRQLLSFIISAFIFLLVFLNCCQDYGTKKFFLKVRKTMLFSLIIVFICGLIEFFVVVLNIIELEPLFESFGALPFVNTIPDYRLHRISSLTYEPPALGTFLITIFGFMFSFIVDSERKYSKYLPTIMVLFLAVVSKSRTALVVIFFQLVVGLFFLYLSDVSFRKFFKKFTFVGSIFILFLTLFFWKNIVQVTNEKLDSLDFTRIEYNSNDNSISNKSRFGIQYALIQEFKENPVIGVGWGQQAFEARYKYPRWAKKNNYEFPEKYLNENLKSFPPGYNLYLRILAEAGLLGFLAFIIFILSIFVSSFKIYKNSIKYKNKFIAISLIISFSGYLLNWLQIDSFRLYGFWVSLAILIYYKNELKQNNSFNTAF